MGLVGTVTMLLLVARSVAFADPATGQATGPLPLSLDEAIQAALTHNPQVLSARLLARIRQHGVAAESARFGRSLRADVTHQTQRALSISTLESVETVTSSLVGVDVAIEQQLASGAQIGVSLRNQRGSSNAAYRLIDPVYESDVGIEFVQPLLRGRGSVNRVDLQLSKNELRIAEVSRDEQAHDLRARVRTAYGNLSYAAAHRAVQEQLAQGARRVLETAQTRATMGAGPRSEILQAEVGVARRQEQVIVAEGQVHQAEDQLKSLTGLDRDPALWDRRLLLTTVTWEDAGSPLDLREGVARAVAADPELRRGELRIQSFDLLARQAQDLARPQVDLSGRLGISGIGANAADNGEALAGADGRSWHGGLSLRLPLGADPQAERYHQRLLEKEHTVIDLERLHLTVVQQVREQYRQVTISRQRTQRR